jgi:hypothetical protein
MYFYLNIQIVNILSQLLFPDLSAYLSSIFILTIWEEVVEILPLIF